ncbi:hypothetical protein BURMUCF1_1094 [Burkholderia multivorans ATCC BAA-247]|nr:hypothetical protein BURMUCF1_1094 [Burkholderia multivorans ATCC BAA-247]
MRRIPCACRRRIARRTCCVERNGAALPQSSVPFLPERCTEVDRRARFCVGPLCLDLGKTGRSPVRAQGSAGKPRLRPASRDRSGCQSAPTPVADDGATTRLDSTPIGRRSRSTGRAAAAAFHPIRWIDARTTLVPTAFAGLRLPAMADCSRRLTSDFAFAPFIRRSLVPRIHSIESRVA